MNTLFTISNGLSIVRAPLALLFLQQNVYLRVLAILLAMFTDSIDGYVARKCKTTSKLGAILDPAMDKLFVYFVIGVLSYEGSFKTWQVAALLSRDIGLFFFAVYLTLFKRWKGLKIKSILFGKASTALQFCVLFGVTLNFSFPKFVYIICIILGALAFFELIYFSKYKTNKKIQ
jgi:CDP-diacylglycerol---glycerol-3-phosphate 3-phosphatidyltransferase